MRGVDEIRALRAVLVDLDDTLYPQASWLAGAWEKVVTAAAVHGVAPDRLRAALQAQARAGTARGGLIDAALAAVGATDVPVPPLVAAFRAHAPSRLDPYPGVARALVALRRAGLRLGVVTDGEPAGQRAKLAATGLAGLFDVVVCSDELGREHRKPSPRPYRDALQRLEVATGEAAFIGDNPRTDIPGAIAAGLLALRVRTGEYADVPDATAPWADVADVPAAVELLLSGESLTAAPSQAALRR